MRNVLILLLSLATVEVMALQDNVHLGAKIRALDEDSAHQVSHHIVEFAKAQGATVLVFEHLANFKPEKGKYSKRGNEKRSYWLRGKIFKYAKYKECVTDRRRSHTWTC